MARQAGRAGREVLGPFLEAGDILGHEPTVVVTEVGPSIANQKKDGTAKVLLRR